LIDHEAGIELAPFTLPDDQGPVNTAPEKFENGGFTLKRIRAPEEFKNATISGGFGFVVEENSDMTITWLSRRHRLRKAPFSKCFPSTRK